MLGPLTALLACQLVGEVVARLAGLPVPGPVIGMALMFAALAVRGSIPEPLGRTSDGLLQHLSLLFVPAGVGVMTQLALVASEGLAISVAVVASTLLTIVVTALLMTWLGRRPKP